MKKIWLFILEYVIDRPWDFILDRAECNLDGLEKYLKQAKIAMVKNDKLATTIYYSRARVAERNARYLLACSKYIKRIATWIRKEKLHEVIL